MRVAALPRRLRPGEAAAERRHEVEEVVTDMRGLFFWRRQDVDRVHRIDARVVQPRGKHVQSPQIAPVLVRHDVVRIVHARAEELVRADERRALERHAQRDGAVAAHPAAARPEASMRSMSSGNRSRSPPIDVMSLALCIDDQAVAVEHDQICLRHVVPERVKEARRDHLGARGQFGASRESKRSR